MPVPSLDQIVAVITAVVTVASILANLIPPSTKLGQALHWLALNSQKVTSATSVVVEEVKKFEPPAAK